MSGLLGTSAALSSDLNLMLQVVILIILVVGYKYGKQKKSDSLKLHGRLMKILVLLNAGSILLFMGPVFVTSLDAVLSETSELGFPLTIVHHVLGLVAEILGVILVFRKFGSVRMWMRLTFVVWLVSWAYGIAFYLVYYVI